MSEIATAEQAQASAAGSSSGRSLWQRLRRIAPFFTTARPGLMLALLGTMITAATEPLISELLKQLLDRGFGKHQFPLWYVPVFVIGLFAVRSIAGYVSQYGLAWASNRAMLAMRRAMFSRLMDAQPILFARHSTSSLVNTITFEIQNGTQQLVNSVQTLGVDTLRLIFLMGYLLYLNWQLTLFVGILFPPVALAMRHLSKRLHHLTVQGQRAVDDLAYVVEENVLAWRIVRLHSAQATEKTRFQQSSEQLKRISIKGIAAAALTTPVTQIVAATVLSAVIVVALWQSSQDKNTVGSFVGFVTGLLSLITPIKHLSEVSGPLTRGLAALDRGMNFIDDWPAERGGSFDKAHAEGHIELRDVSLRYRDDQPAALNGASMTIKPGETVALVGPSGAGKSTLVNLLPRFLDPTSGAALLDGVPLCDWNIHALRRQFALVSQDVVLFNDTIAANVALGGGGDQYRQSVRDALKAANLLDFAEGLPQGLDTLIGHNGSQLSGGQRQRLAIARAVYKDAPILILDEATSALDNESERLVQQALERLMQGRTSLVIAHRLSTIEGADRIVAMDNGRVVEQGTHAELLAHGGLYARLHSLQFRS